MSNKQHEEKTIFLPIIPVKDLVTNIEYIRELNVKVDDTCSRIIISRNSQYHPEYKSHIQSTLYSFATH